MTINEIKQTIKKAIPDAEVHIFDPQQDGVHLESVVISPSFEGMMLVKQHQMVMKALKDAFDTTVHALALKTFTPEKWEQERSKFNL